MQTTGGCVGSAAKFSTGVQFGENNFDTRESGFWLDVNGNSTAVIFYGHTAVFIQFYGDMLAVTGKRLINAVIDDLPEAMHQSAAIGGTDVHARSLPNGLQSF